MRDHRPRAPFEGWPGHWVLGTGLHFWLTPSGPAVVTQITVETVMVADVDAIQDLFDELLAEGLLERLPGLVLLHDWRSLAGVEPEVRARWKARAVRPGNPFSRVAGSYIAVSARPMLRMALQAATTATQLIAGGPPTRFVSDPTEPLRQHGIAAPPSGYLEKWRADRPGRVW